MELFNATGITNKFPFVSIVWGEQNQKLDNLTVFCLFAVLFTFIIST